MTKINVPRLRFREFDGEWQEKKLGNVSKIGDGLHGTPKYSDNGSFAFINGNNLKNNRICTNSSNKYVKESELTSIDNGLNEKSLLISLNGTIGNVAIYNNEKIKLSKSTGYINFNNLNRIFMLYQLSTNYYKNFFQKNVTGTTIKNLSLLTLKTTNVRVTSRLEQQKVGSFFSKIDKLIELQFKKLEQIKKLKQGYLQKMFPQDGESVPRLRFSGFSGEWKEFKLKETLKVGKSGGTPSTKNKEYYDGTIPFLSIKDVTESNGTINDTEKHINNEAIENSSSWIVPKGALTISMYASVGSVAKFNSDIATSQAFFNMIFNDGIEADFMYHFFNQYNLMGKWNRLIATGTQGNLNATEINNILIRIPSEIEQQKIGSFLSKIDQMIDNQSDKIDELKQQKKAYLQKMFV